MLYSNPALMAQAAAVGMHGPAPGSTPSPTQTRTPMSLSEAAYMVLVPPLPDAHRDTRGT
jgi:hypothetical protein